MGLAPTGRLGIFGRLETPDDAVRTIESVGDMMRYTCRVIYVFFFMMAVIDCLLSVNFCILNK